MKSILKGIFLAFSMTVAPIAGAQAADLTMFHSWSNESEISALNVFVNALKAKGNTIKELAIPHEQSGAGPVRTKTRGLPVRVDRDFEDLPDQAEASAEGEFEAGRSE